MVCIGHKYVIPHEVTTTKNFNMSKYLPLGSLTGLPPIESVSVDVSAELLKVYEGGSGGRNACFATIIDGKGGQQNSEQNICPPRARWSARMSNSKTRASSNRRMQGEVASN